MYFGEQMKHLSLATWLYGVPTKNYGLPLPDGQLWILSLDLYVWITLLWDDVPYVGFAGSNFMELMDHVSLDVLHLQDYCASALWFAWPVVVHSHFHLVWSQVQCGVTGCSRGALFYPSLLHLSLLVISLNNM